MNETISGLAFVLFCACLLHDLVGALKPQGRWGQSAALVEYNLYVFGGRLGATPLPNSSIADTGELLVLNINQSFSTSDPPWSEGQEGSACAYHTANAGGAKYDTLVIYGGETPDQNPPASSLSYFNSGTDKWTTNVALSTTPARRMEHSGAMRNDSTIFYFAGIPITGTNSAPPQFYNDLFSLDTKTNTWKTISAGNAPVGRFHHSATILDDGKMYVIGGYTASGMVNMNQIYVFDTNAGSWTVVTAGGNIPSQRRAHRAVGTRDGKVVIFGGTDQNYTQLYNDVIILDTTSNPPSWISQSIQGPMPPGRYAHSMAIAGTNIIVAFGYSSQWQSDTNLYVLDTTTWTWTTQYQPQNLPPLQSPSPTAPVNSASPINTFPGGGSGSNLPSSHKNISLIIGSTIGGVAILAAIVGLLFFSLRRHNVKSNNITTQHYNEQPQSTPPFTISSGKVQNGDSDLALAADLATKSHSSSQNNSSHTTPSMQQAQLQGFQTTTPPFQTTTPPPIQQGFQTTTPPPIQQGFQGFQGPAQQPLLQGYMQQPMYQYNNQYQQGQLGVNQGYYDPHARVASTISNSTQSSSTSGGAYGYPVSMYGGHEIRVPGLDQNYLNVNRVGGYENAVGQEESGHREVGSGVGGVQNFDTGRQNTDRR